MSDAGQRTARALALADEVASQMYYRFGRRFPLDELQSLAREAALAAAARWDGRGQLVRFVVQRTRWAVLGAVRVRRRLGPRASLEALHTAAAFAHERAADATALEMEGGDGGRLSIEETASSAAPAGAGGETSDRAAAMRAFLGRAAACFAVDLDAASTFEIADPEVDVEAETERLRVRRAVQALPADERTVVERHGYGGESFEEIASSEKQSKSTVHSRFARALERLRQTLGERSE